MPCDLEPARRRKIALLAEGYSKGVGHIRRDCRFFAQNALFYRRDGGGLR